MPQPNFDLQRARLASETESLSSSPKSSPYSSPSENKNKRRKNEELLKQRLRQPPPPPPPPMQMQMPNPITLTPLQSPNGTNANSQDVTPILIPSLTTPIKNPLLKSIPAYWAQLQAIEALSSSAEHKLLVDTHCHLDFIAKKCGGGDSLRYYLEKRWKESPDCFEGCIAIYCQPYQWWKYGIERFLETPDPGYPKIWAAYGTHPHFANDFTANREMQLAEMLTRPNVVALGEIGLDYAYKNTVNHEVQKEAFRVQLKMALQRKLPVVLHIREATDDGMEILRAAGLPSGYPLHLHCFNDDWATCEEWLNEFSGLKVGLTGLVFKQDRWGQRIAEVCRKLPLDRLLLETDAPYFLPDCTYDEFAHPGHVAHVLARIAELRPEPVLQILQATRNNAEEVYGLDKKRLKDLKLEEEELTTHVEKPEFMVKKAEERNNNIKAEAPVKEAENFIPVPPTKIIFRDPVGPPQRLVTFVPPEKEVIKKEIFETSNSSIEEEPESEQLHSEEEGNQLYTSSDRRVILTESEDDEPSVNDGNGVPSYGAEEPGVVRTRARLVSDSYNFDTSDDEEY